MPPLAVLAMLAVLVILPPLPPLPVLAVLVVLPPLPPLPVMAVMAVLPPLPPLAVMAVPTTVSRCAYQLVTGTRARTTAPCSVSTLASIFYVLVAKTKRTTTSRMQMTRPSPRWA